MEQTAYLESRPGISCQCSLCSAMLLPGHFRADAFTSHYYFNDYPFLLPLSFYQPNSCCCTYHQKLPVPISAAILPSFFGYRTRDDRTGGRMKSRSIQKLNGTITCRLGLSCLTFKGMTFRQGKDMDIITVLHLSFLNIYFRKIAIWC